MKYQPTQSTEELYQSFREFCAIGVAENLPYSHLKTVVQVGKGLPDEELVQLTGFWLLYYNVGKGYTHYADAPRDPAGLWNWIHDMWHFICPKTFHRRGTNRRPAAAHEAALALTSQAPQLVALARGCNPATPTASYQRIERACRELPSFGRYVSMRLAIVLMQRCCTTDNFEDIHAKGGVGGVRYPLALLYPDELNFVVEGKPFYKTEKSTQVAEICATRLLDRLLDDEVVISHTELSTSLCNWQVMLRGKEYPGYVLDRELPGIAEAGKYVDNTPVFAARRELYGGRYVLGEEHGWAGIRPAAQAWWQNTGEVYIPERDWHKTLQEA